MAVAFVAMFGVGIAQITVGFYALDRLGLEAAAAARVAGIALTLVGVALVLSQIVVRRLALPPQRMIRIGGVVAACGFAAVAWVDTVWGLWACYFVSAAGMGWIFPAFAALAANAVEAHEQGATAGSIGAAQGMGMVTGPLIGTLLYAAGPAVPYLLVAAMLLVMALWPRRSGTGKALIDAASACGPACAACRAAPPARESRSMTAPGPAPAPSTTPGAVRHPRPAGRLPDRCAAPGQRAGAADGQARGAGPVAGRAGQDRRLDARRGGGEEDPRRDDHDRARRQAGLCRESWASATRRRARR